MTDDEIADIIKSDKWLAAMQKVMDGVPDPWSDEGIEARDKLFDKPKLRLIRGGKYGT